MKEFGIGAVFQISFKGLIFAAICAGYVEANLRVALAAEEITKDCKLYEAIDGGTRSERRKQVEYNFKCLRAKLEHVQRNVEIPPGTIAAFVLPSCPGGWSSFKEAGGRFIVGAGEHLEGGNKDQINRTLSTYEISYVQGEPKYQTGGEEKHQLIEDEMPEHNHSLGRFRGEQNDFLAGSTAGFGIASNFNNRVEVAESKAISDTGKSQAHNNMPPYIALYFCRKKNEG